MSTRHLKPLVEKGIRKSLTGIAGLDQVTEGGLPEGRSTLVCGPAGSGKTILAMEFLVRGATQFNEPGVFIALEESGKDLTENVAFMDLTLRPYARTKKS